jgi:CHASE1-domain containing sensor protein
VVLVQNGQQASLPGFLMYFPIYRKNTLLSDDASAEQRMAALQGFAYSPIRADELMHDLLGPADRTVRLEIFDGAGPRRRRCCSPANRNPPIRSSIPTLPAHRAAGTAAPPVDAALCIATRV